MSVASTTAAQAAAPAREVVSLDGTWEIIFDPANEGRGQWERLWRRQEVFTSHPGRREISVPSCWETIEKDYEGVAFYGRQFTVPTVVAREDRSLAVRRGELHRRGLRRTITWWGGMKAVTGRSSFASMIC